MTLAASAQLPGLPRKGYYAPNFRIEVEGRELDPQSHGDVLELKVVMDVKDLTSFDLTVNNWDDRTLFFKYSDMRTFDVGNRVVVHMGYADEMQFMAAGQITALTPHFPESGPPTLGVTGVDSLVRLRGRRPTAQDVKSWANKKDWEVAKVIAQRNRLDIRVTEEGPTHPVIAQGDLDDASFLMRRAEAIDFECYVHMDPKTLRDTLHFVKPQDGRQGTRLKSYVFEWGKTLVNFHPTLSLRDQVSKVTVRGWDPRTKQPISYTADPALDLPAPPQQQQPGATGPKVAGEKLGDRQDVVVNQNVASVQEARELAMSLLRRRAYNFLTGTGQAIGLPDLRPADNVELRGLGRRFSGVYYVNKVTHTLGANGYQTQFEVRKTQDGGVQSN